MSHGFSLARHLCKQPVQYESSFFNRVARMCNKLPCHVRTESKSNISIVIIIIGVYLQLYVGFLCIAVEFDFHAGWTDYTFNYYFF